LSSSLIFLLSAAAVAGAGVRLAKDGDTIAEGTGLGGMWVGAILVAAATSLPELLTDVNAVLQGNESLAVGDLFGSSMVNMLILAVADLLTRKPRLLARVAMNQMLVGTLGIILTVIAALGVLAGAGVGGFPLGWSSAVILFTYVAGMRLLHRNREEPVFRSPAEAAKARPGRPELRQAVVGFSASALAVLIAAPFLASSAAALADATGLSHGFAGMFFLAITTSLPEAAVSYGSVRAGAYNLAVGNLLGSNCFNMAVLAPLDLVQGSGSMLAEVAPELAMGGLFAVLLTALAMLDVMNKGERRLWVLEPGPAFMIATYAAGLFAAYRLAGM
jgi:cation:H+ antiporter